MIINLKNLIFLFVILIFSCEASAQTHTTLVAPLKKDAATSLYTMTLSSDQRYAVDLSAPFSWRRCSSHHHHPTVACMSTECFQAQYLLSPTCDLPITTPPDQIPCSCTVTPVNPRTKSCASAQLTTGNLTLSWSDGANPTAEITLNHTYLSCAPQALFHSLPKGVVGLASLSLAPLSFPSQFSSVLGLSRKFAICLPSTSSGNGVVFFGDGPYNLLPPTSFDATSFLSYTPLLRNPKTADYFIGIKALSVGGESIAMSPSEGIKLSAFVAYTTLRTDIYKLFLKFFMKAMKGIPLTKKARPFSTCFNASEIGFSRVGLRVPQIDLEFADGKNWTIYGTNSMKQVGGDSACFAFLDGGRNPEHSIVIGSFQMEDNLLLFDLDQSRLGFSSSLLFERITCGNFNFTTSV